MGTKLPPANFTLNQFEGPCLGYCIRKRCRAKKSSAQRRGVGAEPHLLKKSLAQQRGIGAEPYSIALAKLLLTSCPTREIYATLTIVGGLVG